MKTNKKDKRKAETSSSSSSSSSSDSDDSSSSSNESRDSSKSRNKWDGKKRKIADKPSKTERSVERSNVSEDEQPKKARREEYSKYKKPRTNSNEARSSHRSKDDYDKRSKYRDRDEEVERSRHSDVDRRKDKNDDRMKNDNDRYRKPRDREESNRYDRSKNYRSSNARERSREGHDRKPPFRDGYGRKNQFNDYRRGRNRNRRDRSRSNSFDHSNAKWGKADEDKSNKAKGKPGEKEKPNFGLSGKLAEETNTYRGVVIKYSEPPEARKPKRRWRLYPFKGEKALQTLFIHRESAYLIGRDRKVVDLPVDHPSCSKQHAVLQYRLVSFTREDGSAGKRVRPYIIDLESANGTFLNGKRIDPKKFVELLERDVIKFGFSSREYVLLHENSKDETQDDDVKQEEEEVSVKEEPER